MAAKKPLLVGGDCIKLWSRMTDAQNAMLHQHYEIQMAKIDAELKKRKKGSKLKATFGADANAPWIAAANSAYLAIEKSKGEIQTALAAGEGVKKQVAARKPEAKKAGRVVIGEKETTLVWEGKTKTVPTQAFRRLQRVVGLDDEGNLSNPPLTYEEAGRMEDAERVKAGVAPLKDPTASVQKSLKQHFGLGKDIVETVAGPDVSTLNRGVVASEVDPDAVSNEAEDTADVESKPKVSDEMLEDTAIDAGAGVFDNKRDHAVEGRGSGFQIGESLQKVNTGLIGADNSYAGKKDEHGRESGATISTLPAKVQTDKISVDSGSVSAINLIAAANRSTKVGRAHRLLAKTYAGTPEGNHPVLARIIADALDHEAAVLEKRKSRQQTVFKTQENSALEARNAAIIARNEAELAEAKEVRTVGPLEADAQFEWNRSLDEGDVEWAKLPQASKDEYITLYSQWNDGTLQSRQYYEQLQDISDAARGTADVRQRNSGAVGAASRGVSDVGGGRDNGPGGTSADNGRSDQNIQNSPAAQGTAPKPVVKKKRSYTLPGKVDPLTKNPDLDGEPQLARDNFSSGEEAANWLAANDGRLWIKQAMRAISPLLKNSSVHILAVGDDLSSIASKMPQVPSEYHRAILHAFTKANPDAAVSAALPDGTSITVMLRGASGFTNSGLAHELIHNATVRAIEAGDTRFNSIARQFQSALINGEPGRAYSAADKEALAFFGTVVNNPKEFVAYALTSDTLQRLMQCMGADGKWFTSYRTGPEKVRITRPQPARVAVPTAPKYTLWNRFVDAILSLFKLPTRFRGEYESLLAARDGAIATNKKADTVEYVPLKEEIDRLLSEFVADQQNRPTANNNLAVSASVTPLTARTGGRDSAVSAAHLRPTNVRVEKAVTETATRVLGRSGSLAVDSGMHTVKKLAASLQSLHDLVNEYSPTLKSAKKWYQSVLATQATRRRLESDAEEVASAADKLKTRDNVNKFVSLSTFEQKWGYGPKRDAGMGVLFDALSKDEQAVVKSIFAHGDKMLAARRKILDDLGISNIFTNGVGMDGPYAPLKRFGNFVGVLKSSALVAAENAKTKEGAALAYKLKSDPKHYVVTYFDSMGLAKQFAKDNEGKYAQTSAFEKSVRVGEERPMNAELLQRVLSAVKAEKVDGTEEELAAAKEARAALTKMIKDMYFESIDEQHARTSGLHRKNRAGYDADMVRSFLSHARAEAAFLANLEHGGETNAAFYEMQREARGDGAGGWEGQDKFNMLASHYAESLKYDETPWQDRAMAFTSAMQLATSVGYHVTNAMQGIMVTVPQLAADFNNYSGAWGHLLKGYGVLRDAGWRGNFDITKVKDAGLRAALQKAMDDGLLDVGMEEDLGHFDRTKTGIGAVDKTTGVAASALHKLRQISRAVETANRVAAATAGYNMSMEAHGDLAKAQAYAIRTLQTTQGDFSRTGAPLALKKLPKLVTQYKKYQLMMAALYVKAFRQVAWGSDTERSIGKRMLAYKLAHTSVAAGVLGMPLMNLVAAVFSGLGGDDEPKDLERSLRELIGDGATADLLLHGPLAFAGLDMSAKLGDDKIFSILPYGTWDVSSASGLGKTAMSLAGPAVSQAGKMADGVGAMARGDYYKGLEKFMPKGVADGMKAFRISNEGYSLKNGDIMFKPEDINGMTLALDALGMPSSRMKHMDWLRGQQYEVSRFFIDRSKAVEHEYAAAIKDGDTEAAAKARTDWMELQAGKDNLRHIFGDSHDALKRQPLGTLLKYPQTVRERERKLQKAVPKD